MMMSNPRSLRRIRQWDGTYAWLTLAMLGMWAALHWLTGTSFYGATPYNTYTLQALSWRAGRTYLAHDYPILELAIYQGRYYVSFPPLPSLVELPLTLLFGESTPDNLLVKVYAWGACLMMYRALKKEGYGRWAGGMLAFFVCFASSLLPLTLSGAVWYHAQTLAFFLTITAGVLLAADRPTFSLLCYALSVGCRPFNALYALPLFFVYFSIHARAKAPLLDAGRRLLPGIGLGLCVAAALGIYNYIRFGNPLEFGHNYLPEFSTQGGTQFSLSHVRNNLKTFLLGLPLRQTAVGWQFEQFGFSLLIACPTVGLTLLRAVADLFRKRLTREKAVIVGTMVLHLFLLLLHRTFGGFQLGARYVVDLIPYSFFYLLLCRRERAWTIAYLAVMLPVLALMVIGTVYVHI